MEVVKEFNFMKKVKDDNNKWGYKGIDDKKVIVELKYDYVGDLQHGGFITTKIGNLWGIIQIKYEKVKQICEERYNYISSFKNEYATVLKETGYNFINQEGNELFDQDFTEIMQRLPGDLAIVRRDNLFGVVCLSTGKEVYPCTYTAITTCGKKIKLQQEFVIR